MRRVSAFLQRYPRMILAVLALLVVWVVLWIFFAPIFQWSSSAQSFDVVAFLGEHLPAVALVSGCLLIPALIGLIIWLPKWQAARPELTPQARFEGENTARKTLAEIVGGAALLAGLYFTWSSLEVSWEGQVTERFSKAIDQLGAINDKGEKQLEIRLGGIYALARIARDSKNDHWPVMEVLTAYVREHAPGPPKDTSPLILPATVLPCPKGDPAATQRQPPPKLATDIQAILTVLGQRTHTYEKAKNQRLNLENTNLRGAALSNAQLQRATLTYTQLQRANLTHAQLQGATLMGTQLEEAALVGAQLQGAALTYAQLQGADLRGARLEEAKYLTVEQLSTVKTLYGAQLDPPLQKQIQQLYPQLLEKPQE